jgi:hypothetical protein
MPRKLIPRPCNCGGTTKGGEWLPGHDQKLRAAIEVKAAGMGDAGKEQAMAKKRLQNDLMRVLRLTGHSDLKWSDTSGH